MSEDACAEWCLAQSTCSVNVSYYCYYPATDHSSVTTEEANPEEKTQSWAYRNTKTLKKNQRMKRRNCYMQIPREMCSWHSALCWRKDFFIMLTLTWAVPSISGDVFSQAFPHCQGDSHTRADMLHAQIVS